MDLHGRTPTQRLQDSIDLHDMTTRELVRLVRDANHELHIRIDGLTPGADDNEHREFHRRAQDREITEIRDGALKRAQYWAGIRIGVTVVAVIAIVAMLYAAFINLR
jgi:hypothetical protein